MNYVYMYVFECGYHLKHNCFKFMVFMMVISWVYLALICSSFLYTCTNYLSWICYLYFNICMILQISFDRIEVFFIKIHLIMQKIKRKNTHEMFPWKKNRYSIIWVFSNIMINNHHLDTLDNDLAIAIDFNINIIFYC